MKAGLYAKSTITSFLVKQHEDYLYKLYFVGGFSIYLLLQVFTSCISCSFANIKFWMRRSA